MNGTKMSKKFFFKVIEEELKDLEKEVEELKEDNEMSCEMRLAKGNMLFGRLSELKALNFAARDVDYWEYSKLDEKIYEVREKI